MAITKILNIYGNQWNASTDADGKTINGFTGIKNTTNKPADTKYGPWWSVSDALAAVSKSFRYYGLKMGVVTYSLTDPTKPDTVDNRTVTGLTEYTFKKGLEDADVEEVGGSGSGSGVTDLGTFEADSDVIKALITAVKNDYTSQSKENLSLNVYKGLSTQGGCSYEFLFNVVLNSDNTEGDCDTVTVYQYYNGYLTKGTVYLYDDTQETIDFSDINLQNNVHYFNTATERDSQIEYIVNNTTFRTRNIYHQYYILNTDGTTYNQYCYIGNTSPYFKLVQESVAKETIINNSSTIVTESYKELGTFSSEEELEKALLNKIYEDNNSILSNSDTLEKAVELLGTTKCFYKGRSYAVTSAGQTYYWDSKYIVDFWNTEGNPEKSRVSILSFRTNGAYTLRTIIHIADCKDYTGTLDWLSLYKETTVVNPEDVVIGSSGDGLSYEERCTNLQSTYPAGSAYYNVNYRFLVLYDTTPTYREWVVEKNDDDTYFWLELDVDTDTDTDEKAEGFEVITSSMWGTASSAYTFNRTASNRSLINYVDPGCYFVKNVTRPTITVGGVSISVKQAFMTISRIDTDVKQMVITPQNGTVLFRTGTLNDADNPTTVIWSDWGNVLTKDKISLDFTNYSTARYVNPEAVTIGNIKRVNIGTYKITLSDGTEKELGSSTFTEGVVYEDTIADVFTIPAGTIITVSISTDDVTIDNTTARVLTLY